MRSIIAAGFALAAISTVAAAQRRSDQQIVAQVIQESIAV
jgi:hypothetical protein